MERQGLRAGPQLIHARHNTLRRDHCLLHPVRTKPSFTCSNLLDLHLMRLRLNCLRILGLSSKSWDPLPGAPLRLWLRFVTTLRIRLGSGSGLTSAALFCVAGFLVGIGILGPLLPPLRHPLFRIASLDPQLVRPKRELLLSGGVLDHGSHYSRCLRILGCFSSRDAHHSETPSMADSLTDSPRIRALCERTGSVHRQPLQDHHGLGAVKTKLILRP